VLYSLRGVFSVQPVIDASYCNRVIVIDVYQLSCVSGVLDSVRQHHRNWLSGVENGCVLQQEQEFGRMQQVCIPISQDLDYAGDQSSGTFVNAHNMSASHS
jgi:hypothetical protein